MATNPQTPPADKAEKMTAARAAKAVRRPVTIKGEKGKPDRVSYEPVAESEVLSFRDYGTHVVVVTNDGQKFSSADVPAKAEA